LLPQAPRDPRVPIRELDLFRANAAPPTDDASLPVLQRDVMDGPGTSSHVRSRFERTRPVRRPQPLQA
jgi:hypothetical protein